MKILKLILCTCLLAFTAVSCESDDDNTDFVDAIEAPKNVSALVTVTQDNTGLVTITPLAEGATTFFIKFGDGVASGVNINQGESAQHIYQEGSYQATIEAVGLNDLTTTITQTIEVSFQAPENLVVDIENDMAVSKQVNVTANADFGLSFEVDFGQAGSEPVMGNIGESVSFVYDEPGTYTITVTAFSAAVDTTVYTEEFLVTEILQPVTAAPTPTRPAANVISIYSDAYTPITINEFPTSWSNTGFAEIEIEGNNTINYSDLAFTGIVTDYDNPTNLNTMDFVHFDYWTTDATTLSFKIVNTAVDPVQEDIESAGDIVVGEWVSVDIALNDFDLDRSQITQLLFDTLGNTANVFIDNLYFYIDTPTAPLVAAPTPTISPENVISIYSDAYTSITVTEFPTSWSDTGFEEVQIEGNNTINYSSLAFTGIVTDYDNPTDLTGMAFVHFDYWTPNATTLGFKMVNTALDPVQEDIESVSSVELGSWISVDIELDDFDMDRSQVTQLLFDALGNTADVYIDNLYFHN